LDKLNIKKINCLLLHDENDLSKINDNKKFFFEILKKYNVKNFGVSVYSIKKAKFALKNFKKISVQFPFNIANNNFKDLRKKNNIFYARSLFLQGLLTEEKIYLQNKKIKIKHDIYKKYLKKNKIDALNIALNYVFMNKNINYYVLGVRSHEQLKNILNFKFKINEQKNLEYCKKIKKLFYKLNDPRKW
jgi:aryl-alcohol dehydrogenase-like predicted oxidoreductase